MSRNCEMHCYQWYGVKLLYRIKNAFLRIRGIVEKGLGHLFTTSSKKVLPIIILGIAGDDFPSCLSEDISRVHF